MRPLYPRKSSVFKIILRKSPASLKTKAEGLGPPLRWIYEVQRTVKIKKRLAVTEAGRFF